MTFEDKIMVFLIPSPMLLFCRQESYINKEDVSLGTAVCETVCTVV